ncbi:hypothetical protein mRhiFer1_009173 [Rhinolophus ferrumequinum]|uniref:Uncharacterized protein n=1 Tax=Rhinolophus ferrumequinum TaxID=59479 RepID=A0A7J7SJ66_RHIFE|nr:hypothetical protein mRhiFer1_009173 [Rhinolophus ferrumequinum]
MSAKNLPVISKLRQKVPPVLSAVNKHLPLHRNDLPRTEGCSVGLLPCKDIDRSTCSTGGDSCLERALLPTIRAERISLHFSISSLLPVSGLKASALHLSTSLPARLLHHRKCLDTWADQPG